MKKTYLLLFSIAPVQDYIKQARKTQDLYAGSFILSYLCRKAIRASGITEDQLIFPKFTFADPPPSLSNRFLAVIERDLPDGQEESSLKTYGQSIQDEVEKTFLAIAHRAIADTWAKDIHYHAQVQHYLTIQWAFLSLPEGKYPETYAELEALLGAIKQVRAFDQLPETGRKCAICGERNVKFYRKSKTEHEKNRSDADLKHTKLFTEDVHIVDYKYNREFSPKMLQPGEGVCAVCFMKRGAETYFQENPEEKRHYHRDFPSTPEIALLDARYAPQPIEPSLWQKAYDGHVIFDLFEQAAWQRKTEHDQVRYELPEHARRKVQEKYPDLDKELSNSCAIATELKNNEELSNSCAIATELKNNEVRPSPYYALLCFDGDSMGKWLSGAYLKESERANLRAFHQDLSEKLMTFAEEVRAYFKAHEECGRVIYTGGDDFLGFISLNSLFPVMKLLREKFDSIDVSQWTEPGCKLTFSAGAVIAHIKTPMSEVLKQARAMEHAAKHIDDQKDAFAVAVLKHSGEIQQTLFKWRADDTWLLDECMGILHEIRQEHFSGAFLKNITQEFRRLLNPDGTLPNIDLLEPETRRLVDRACELKRQPEDSQEAFKRRKDAAIDRLTRKLKTLYENTSIGNKLSFENVFFALGIIDFFTRKGTLCKQSPSQP